MAAGEETSTTGANGSGRAPGCSGWIPKADDFDNLDAVALASMADWKRANGLEEVVGKRRSEPRSTAVDVSNISSPVSKIGNIAEQKPKRRSVTQAQEWHCGDRPQDFGNVSWSDASLSDDESSEEESSPVEMQRTMTLVGDEQWAPMLLKSFFRPHGLPRGCGSGPSPDPGADTYLTDCKQTLLSLVPGRPMGKSGFRRSNPAYSVSGARPVSLAEAGSAAATAAKVAAAAAAVKDEAQAKQTLRRNTDPRQ
jgi:hypothetical protein